MALTSTVYRIDAQGNGANVISVALHCTITTDAKDVGDAGIRGRDLVVHCESTRAAFDAYVAQCQCIDAAGWPEGAIPLPVGKKP